jgi:hypothetical protein
MRHASVAVLAFCAAACGGADTSASADVIRTDSAGVRIVSSMPIDRPLAWTFEAIGPMRDSLGEPFLFEGLTARHVLVDRAGRTYALTREPSIVRFSREGVANRSFGRKGSGPGEMEFPVALVVQGDSLVALDVMRNMLVRYGPTLEPIDELPLRDGLEDVTAIAFRVGGLWLQRQEFSDGAQRVALYGDSSRAEPLLALPSAATTPVEMCGGSVRISLPPLFSPELHWATDRGHLLANRGPGYDLHLYEASRLYAIVRRAIPARAPTAADVPRLFPNGFKVRVGNRGECEHPLGELSRATGMAATMPLVHGVALLSDGTIWAQRTLRGEEPTVLDVFGSDGAYLGSLSGFALPLARLPNGEMLFAREDTATGGQHLVRYRVTR